MKLGFLTGYSEERVEFAGKAGFDCLEIQVSPGSSLDLNKTGKKQLREVRDVLEKNRVEAATVICVLRHLDPDINTRRENIKYFIKALEAAKEIGAPVVTTCALCDPAKNLDGNLPVYREVFREYARVAESLGIKIGIENWPCAGGYPVTIGSVAATPAGFQRLFETVSSEAIGLELDPSHFYWQGIDYIAAVYEFGKRIYSVHAKDTEIIRPVYHRVGIYGSGWWRYRIPGWGEIDWKEFMKALNDVGYDGPVIIEHEDPIFSGRRFDEGLHLGLRFLRQFIE